MMIQKSTLVLCDTCIILEAFRLNVWDNLVKEYNIVVSETIVNETKYYTDISGNDISINLNLYKEVIAIVSKTPSEVSKFTSDTDNGFDASYLEKFDPGETELLCHLYENRMADILICSSDHITFKTLGKLLMSDKGISLEELLTRKGLHKKLDYQYTKNFREQVSKAGFANFTLPK